MALAQCSLRSPILETQKNQATGASDRPSDENTLYVYASKTRKKSLSNEDFNAIRKLLMDSQVEQIVSRSLVPEAVRTISTSYDSGCCRGLIVCADANTMRWYQSEIEKIYLVENNETRLFRAWKKDEVPRAQSVRVVVPPESSRLDASHLLQLLRGCNPGVFEETDRIEYVENLAGGGKAVHLDVCPEGLSAIVAKKWRVDFPLGQLSCSLNEDLMELDLTEDSLNVAPVVPSLPQDHPELPNFGTFRKLLPPYSALPSEGNKL